MIMNNLIKIKSLAKKLAIIYAENSYIFKKEFVKIIKILKKLLKNYINIFLKFLLKNINFCFPSDIIYIECIYSSDKEKKQILTLFNKIFKKQHNLHFVIKTNIKLIGGFLLKNKDIIFEYSINNYLNQIYKSFIYSNNL